MARLFSVDFTGVESGGKFVRVPEDDYAVKLVEIKGKKGSDSGKPFLDAAFKLTQGNKRGTGKIIRHSFSLQKQSLWNLRNWLEACGKQVPSKAMKLDMDKMIGLECACTVIDDQPYEGKIKSVISAFFPIADLGNTSETGDEIEEGVEEATEDSFEEEKPKPAAKKGKAKPKEEEVTEEEPAEEEESEDLFS